MLRRKRLAVGYTLPMRFSPNLLEEILRRTDLVQLVGRRVKLTRKGRVMWGCCPFHKEKTPSFKVENERRTYHCFGCGAGGDAFKWLTETEGLTFPESVEKLASEAGVELPKWTAEDDAREERRKSLYEIVETACVFFEEQLRARCGTEGRSYLQSRGLDDAAAKQFRLGYAPSNDALKDHLYKSNIPLEGMISAGLARPQDGDRPARDFFFNRLMFPIADTRGRTIAFGARALDHDAKPKYINTGETPLFSKGRLLYNFASARPAALQNGTIILAEGYMDVIALVRAGFAHAVAPLGTALTEDQLALLWRTAPEPILAFDGDDAGLRAAQRAARLALPHLKPGCSLRFAFMPPGEDPDSLIRASGPAAMKKVLDAAEPLSKVLWRMETEGKEFDTPERRAGLERALAEIVSSISDQKIADYYRRDFDQKVFDSFKRRAPAQRTEFRDQRPPTREGRRWSAPPVRALETVSPAVKNSMLARAGNAGARRRKETELVEMLLESPQIAISHGEQLAALPFSDRSLDRLRQELLNLAASGSSLEKMGLENHLIRAGLGELLDRLVRRSPEGHGENAGKGSTDAAQGDAEVDMEARWLLAAAQLHEMAEAAPERRRAMERFNSEASEESWREAHRLLQPRALPNE
jgi:DNA primase